MSFQTFVTEQLASITTRLNNLGTNAKKIDELPVQSTIVPTSKIHVSNAGVSESLTLQKIIDQATSINSNILVSVGEITVDGNDVTIPNATWKINNITYFKNTSTTINIPFADTSKTRIDVIYGNALNQILRVVGFETEGIAVRPNLPLNSVVITEITVTDSTIEYVPHLLFVGEFTQSEFDSAEFFALDGSYAFVENAGVRKTYWYSQALDGWFTWDTGGGGGIPDAPEDGELYGRKDAAWALISLINDLTTGGTTSFLSAQQGVVLKGLVDSLIASRAGGLKSALFYEDRENQWTAGTGTISGSFFNLNFFNRLLYLSLGNDNLLNDIDVVVTKDGGEIDGMEYKVFNSSDHVVTLVPGSGITLIGDNFVIPKNHTAIIKNEQMTGSFSTPTEREGVFSVTYQNNGVSLGAGYATEEYVDSEISVAVVGLLDDRGNHDASSNTFPSSGGSGASGAILKGDLWTISVAGTLVGVSVTVGDVVRAKVDSPGSTSSNWVITENNIGYVPENSANKATTMTGNTASNTVFLSAKAIYDWATGLFWQAVDASGLVKGIMKLYTSTGSNTDGTMDQNSISHALSLKQNIENDFDSLVNNSLSYFIPTYNGTTFANILRTGTISLNGNGNVSDRIANVLFSTTAVAGTLAFQRGTPMTINLFLTYQVIFKAKIKFATNISDTRFFSGLSSMFSLTAPTNVEPDTMINSVGIAKISTSNNLHIIHNDATGMATKIDLGVSYPCSSAVDEWYSYEIRKNHNSGDAIVIIIKCDAAGVKTMVSTTIVTDLPSATLYPVSWICNNASAAVSSFKHYGCVLTQKDLF